jgi:hypothetical protein
VPAGSLPDDGEQLRAMVARGVGAVNTKALDGFQACRLYHPWYTHTRNAERTPKSELGGGEGKNLGALGRAFCFMVAADSFATLLPEEENGEEDYEAPSVDEERYPDPEDACA